MNIFLICFGYVFPAQVPLFTITESCLDSFIPNLQNKIHQPIIEKIFTDNNLKLKIVNLFELNEVVSQLDCFLSSEMDQYPNKNFHSNFNSNFVARFSAPYNTSFNKDKFKSLKGKEKDFAKAKIEENTRFCENFHKMYKDIYSKLFENLMLEKNF